MMRKQPTQAPKSVESQIVAARGQAVLLDSDLAELYGVQTRALNQAMKRNLNRFPTDFAFRLSREEAGQLARSRSQSVILKRGQNVKHLPWAFTEHGAIMAASVLNSPRAVEMSIFVVRAFVRLRSLSRTHAELASKLDALERRVTGHDEELKKMFTGLRALLSPQSRPSRRIGFGDSR